MGYLTINGIDIPIAQRGRRVKTWDIIGDRARSVLGTLREARTAEKAAWRFRTDRLTQEVGDALQGLLLGQGHHFSYDTDAYSDYKGLPGTATDTPTPGASAHTKFGNYLQLDATDKLTYATELTGNYTVLFWLWDGVSAWDLFAFNDAGSKWKNGVTHAPAIVAVTVDGSGNLVVGDAANAYDIDDVVAVPYRMPDSWIENDLAAPAAAFSDLPKLNVSGDILGSSTVSVFGRPDNVDFTEFHDPDTGTWEAHGQIIDLLLVEV